MAANVDITYDQSSTFTQSFLVYSDAAETQLANLSSFVSGLMEIRSSYDSSTIIYTANLANSQQMTVDGPNGNVTIFLTPNSLSSLLFQNGQNLDSQDCVYDVKLWDSGGNTFFVSRGTITVERPVTR